MRLVDRTSYESIARLAIALVAIAHCSIALANEVPESASDLAAERSVWATYCDIEPAEGLISESTSDSNVATAASAEDSGPDITAQIEIAAVAATAFGSFSSNHRLTRTQVKYENGPLTIVGTWYDYDLCLFKEVDESFFAYRKNSVEAKAGRFYAPIGLTSWYDQWYAGFVHLPMQDKHAFADSFFKEHTSTGFQIDFERGPTRLQFAAISDELERNRIFPSRIGNFVARLQHYRGNLVVGGTAGVDTKTLGDKRRLLALDLRYTVPGWVFRGEFLQFDSDADDSRGFYVDAAYRVPRLENLTLVARHQRFDERSIGGNKVEVHTLGFRLRMPIDAFLVGSYTFGPDMNKLMIGPKWAFGIMATIRF